MRTFAFILFAVVMISATALSTLMASRYLSLEKEIASLRSELEKAHVIDSRQAEEKTASRLEQTRVQADLEARFDEQRSQLEECNNERLRQAQEILTSLSNLQRRLTDIQALVAPSAKIEKTPAGGTGGAGAPEAAPVPGAPAPGVKETSVPGAPVPDAPVTGAQPTPGVQAPDAQTAPSVQPDSGVQAPVAPQPAPTPASPSAPPSAPNVDAGPPPKTDIPHGAIPTREQESQKLQKAGGQ